MGKVRKARSEVKALVHNLLSRGYKELSNDNLNEAWIIRLQSPDGFVLKLTHSNNGWLEQEMY